MKFVFAFVKGQAVGFYRDIPLGDEVDPAPEWETFGNKKAIFPRAFNSCGSNSAEGARASLRGWLDACGFPGTEIREAEGEAEGLHVQLPRAEIVGERDPDEILTLLQKAYLEETGKAPRGEILRGKVKRNEWVVLLRRDIYGDPTGEEERLWCGGTWLVLEASVGSQWITPVFPHHGEEFVRKLLRGYLAQQATRKALREERDAKEKEKNK